MNDDKIAKWLTENGFKLRTSTRGSHGHDDHGYVSGSGGGVRVVAPTPSRLRRGPYVVRVTEDAVYESHIYDDGIRGLLYQPWVDIGVHPYSTREELKAILTKLTTEPKTCWA